jgi:uncharacterized protein (TIGR03435 family)
MRLILAVSCLTLACLCAYGQAAEVPSFEVATVKPSSSAPRMCSGGPGTASPGIWRCSSVPVAFLIIQAYGFEAYQFPPGSSCCRAEFDIAAKVPEGTTREQFRQMLRNLLAERLKLKFHHEQKEMPIFELTVEKKELKMKESAPDAAPAPEDPWRIPEFSIGKDGCPVFPAGSGGLMQGRDGCSRWTGFGLSMQEIVKTLSFHLGRKVVDATGLKGKYDIDMRWWVDWAWLNERLTPLQREQIGEQPDEGPHGPTLIHAVRDQLGLELISKKGPGDIVVVDHFEKVPVEN